MICPKCGCLLNSNYYCQNCGADGHNQRVEDMLLKIKEILKE